MSTSPDPEHDRPVGSELEVVHQTAVAIPVAEFEGDYIRKMEAKLPQITLEMEEGFSRGTHLKLELEVRIKSVRVEEDRKGDLTRQHILAIEDIKLIGAYTADQMDPGVGGSAAGPVDPQDTTESDARPEGEGHGIDPDAGF